MDIEKNFDKNTKTAIKKNQHRLPPGSKFVLQQLLKNSHHIEENLDKEGSKRRKSTWRSKCNWDL